MWVMFNTSISQSDLAACRVMAKGTFEQTERQTKKKKKILDFFSSSPFNFVRGNQV